MYKPAWLVSTFLTLLLFGCIYASNANALRFASSFAAQTGNDSTAIQQDINSARPGDIVYVSNGIHYEQLQINKSVCLVGEKGSIIDGNNSRKIMIEVTAHDVTITGLQLQNSGYGWNVNGIYLNHVSNCKIEDNIFSNVCHDIRLNNTRDCIVTRNVINGTMYGVRIINSETSVITTNTITGCVGAVHLENATDTLVRNNTIINNQGQGIRFYTPCQNNLVTDNHFIKNDYGGMIAVMPSGQTLYNNSIFHNNFVNNTRAFTIQTNGIIWDDGNEGNYWSDYNGSDLNQDAIGDTPYPLQLGEKDQHPLTAPIHFYSLANQGETMRMEIVCEASVTEMQYSLTSNRTDLTFKTHAASLQSNSLLCRLTIPTAALIMPIQLRIDGVLASLRTIDQSAQQSELTFIFNVLLGDHVILLSGGAPGRGMDLYLIILLGIVSVAFTVTTIVIIRKKFQTKHPK